jgi:arginine repressor
MNEDIRWTYLTHQEIVDKLIEEEIYVSQSTVACLLKLHGFKKRKMSQCKTIKDVENRDEQFINIDRLRNGYLQSGEPVVSVDSKKKEPLGSLYREGEVYSVTAPAVMIIALLLYKPA